MVDGNMWLPLSLLFVTCSFVDVEEPQGISGHAHGRWRVDTCTSLPGSTAGSLLAPPKDKVKPPSSLHLVASEHGALGSHRQRCVGTEVPFTGLCIQSPEGTGAGSCLACAPVENLVSPELVLMGSPAGCHRQRHMTLGESSRQNELPTCQGLLSMLLGVPRSAPEGRLAQNQGSCGPVPDTCIALHGHFFLFSPPVTKGIQMITFSRELRGELGTHHKILLIPYMPVPKINCVCNYVCWSLAVLVTSL